MMNKITFLLLALLTCVGSVFGQTGSASLAKTEGKYKYNYVPVSPAAESLMKLIMCPVNHNTGKLDLSIPIYEIRTRDFTLPLRLQYDSGGIKVSSGNGIAGLGWSMDFGPTMSRSIQGSRDEEGYLIYNPNFGSDDASYLHQITEGLANEQPDVFFYSTFDSQGNFVYKRPEKSSESGTYVPVYLPLTTTKVETTDIRSGFKVTDGSGNIYNFTEAEYTNLGMITGWKLKDVTSLRNDKLSFSYVKQQLTYIDNYDYYAVEDMIEVQKNGYWQGVNGELRFFRFNGYNMEKDSLWAEFKVEDFVSTYDQRPSNSVEAKFPKEITYANGKVVFDYSASLLTGVHIFENGLEIQRVALNYKKLTFMGRALLTEVKFTDLVTNQSRSYTMSYYDSWNNYSPMQTKAVDRFGYYNGKTSNTDLVERQLVEFNCMSDCYYAYIGGADRTPEIVSAQTYSLESIRYPSGASEGFSYDLNTYPEVDEYGNESLAYAGGLRIYSIRCRDVEGNLKNERFFYYEKDGKPTGYVPEVSFTDEMEKLYLRCNSRDYLRYRLYSSLPVADAGASAGVSILYPNVNVVEKDRSGKVLAREEYEFNTDFYFPGILNGMVHDEVSHYKKGKLIRKTDYDVDTDRPVHDEQHNYTSLSLKNNTPVVTGRDVRRANLVVEYQPGVETQYERSYREYRYGIDTGNTRVVPQISVTSDYYDGKSVSDTIIRAYGSTDWDARTGLPVSETYKSSDGKEKRQTYWYPYHENYDPVGKAMTNANDVLKPFFIWGLTKGADGNMIDTSTGYTYVFNSDLGSALLDEVTVWEQEASYSMSESYPVHDAQGNICEIRRDDAPVVALLWGYGYSRPVAIVEGASYQEVVSKLGVSIESLQSLDGSALENRLLSLRSAFPAPCRVTVYRYAPHRGVVYVNEPNGNITTYSYDGFGRLTETRDKDGAVLEYNEYKR